MFTYPIKYRHLEPIFQDSINQISFVAEKYLRYLPREIPHYPSHGSDHSINIIELVDDFVDKWDANLTPVEIYLLYVSAWTHDMGCLIKREDHQIHSLTILDNIEMINELLGKELYTCLKYIVKYHSSKEHLCEVPQKWGSIHLQKICAIFRVLDACDITEKKCPKGVYDIIINAVPPLKEDANQYWIAHMNIESLQFELPEITIYFRDYSKCKLVILRLKDEINDEVRKILSENDVTTPQVKEIEAPKYID
jgi:hypothetical protein